MAFLRDWFLDLEDTPDSYGGQAGATVVVNDTEDGLEFGEGGGGGGPSGGCPEFDETLLFDESSRHLGFPGFVIAADGTFVVGHRNGSQHGTDTSTSRVEIRRSFDRGATWTSPDTILSGGGYDWRGGTLSRTPTGRLVWGGARRFSSTNFPVDSGFVCLSDDNGATWTAPIVVQDFTAFTIADSPVVPLAGGRLLLPVWGRNSGDSASRRSVKLMESFDDGATWSHVSTILSGPAEGTDYNETTVVKVAGRLIAIAREGSSAWVRVVSDDDGATWSSPETVLPGVSGHPKPLRIPDGRILAVWRDSGTSGQPATIGLSDDEGATWTACQQFGSGGVWTAYSQADLIGNDLWLIHSYEHATSNADIYLHHADLGGPASVPPGGQFGQTLTKLSDQDWHTGWQDPPTDDGGGTVPGPADSGLVEGGTTTPAGLLTFRYGIDGDGNPYFDDDGVPVGHAARLFADRATGTFHLEELFL